MLTLWKPFGELFRDDFFNTPDLFRAFPTQVSRFSPAVDITEEPDALVLKAELPGLKPEDIEIEVQNNVLVLKGEHKAEKAEEREGYHVRERRHGTFTRSFMLPETVRTDAIEASLENGVLSVRLPKVEQPKPQRIPVKAGSLVDKAKQLFSKKQSESGEATAG